MKLSRAQQEVMNRITNPNLPLDDGTLHQQFLQHPRIDLISRLPDMPDHRHEDGTISGCFYKSTLEALERKNLITIERITIFYKIATIRLVKPSLMRTKKEGTKWNRN